MGLFLTEERYPGADTNTKRALGQADLNAHAVQKLKEAAKLAKLKADSPSWKESAWAHIGIPSKKVAIVMMGSHLTTKSQGVRDSWSRFGWRCFVIPKHTVDNATVEDLARDLLSAIGGGK